MIDPGRVVVRGRHAFAIRAEDGPEGSAMVLPVAHRSSPFEFTPAEWRETITILAATRDLLSADEAIGGWNIGWNVGRVAGQSVEHAHCHLIPRRDGEPMAEFGLRWWLHPSVYPEVAGHGFTKPVWSGAANP